MDATEAAQRGRVRDPNRSDNSSSKCSESQDTVRAGANQLARALNKVAGSSVRTRADTRKTSGDNGSVEESGEDIPARQERRAEGRSNHERYSLHKDIEDSDSKSESTLADSERRGKKTVKKRKHARVWASEERNQRGKKR